MGTSDDKPPPLIAVPGRRFLLANIAALGGGQGVAMVLSLVTLPIYAAILGAEGLGLIGFTVMLSMLLRIFDMGMTSSVSRQLAGLRGSRGAAAESGDFMRTFELLFVGLAAILIVALSAASPLIARYWLKADSFGTWPAWLIVVLIATLSSVRLVGGFYHACLLGLERQRRSSVLRVIEVVLLHLGAVGLLLFVAGEIGTYFVWAAVSSAISLVVISIATWRCAPGQFASSRFRPRCIREVRRFALGVAAVTVVSVVLTQLDRVVASAVVSLEQFGYYTTAMMATGALSAMFVLPLFNTIYPRFSALISSGNQSVLRKQYLFAVTFLQGVLLPIAAVAFVYGRPVVLVWTQDAALATHAGRILGWLTLAIACNALSVPAYALQLAHGRTSLVTGIAVAMTALAALLFWLTCAAHGLYGLATAVASVHLLGSIILVIWVHRRVLPGLLGRYAGRAVAPAMIGAAACALALDAGPEPAGSRLVMGAWIAAAMVGSWVVTLGLCGLFSGETRRFVDMLRHIGRRNVSPPTADDEAMPS